MNQFLLQIRKFPGHRQKIMAENDRARTLPCFLAAAVVGAEKNTRRFLLNKLEIVTWARLIDGRDVLAGGNNVGILFPSTDYSYVNMFIFCHSPSGQTLRKPMGLLVL